MIEMESIDEEIIKPSDWPQSNIECKLDNVNNAFKKFIKDPSLQNKELLLSLVTTNDLNENNLCGLCRDTDYAVALMNEIYVYANFTQCNQAKIFLYELITDIIIQKKAINMMINNSFEKTYLYTPYLQLMPQLKMFYSTYCYYLVEKDKTFAQQMVLTIKSIKDASPNQETYMEYIEAVTVLLYDLSFTINSPNLFFLNFSRAELSRIFSTLINIWNANNITPCKRPLRGIFTICLANWILKSRGDYNKDLLYKCVPNSAVEKSFINKQVWMKNTKLLNDKREGITYDNIFHSKEWICKDWAKKIKVSNIKSYVCSFSKEKPNDTMLKKYGHNVYGYKNDRIANSLSPLYYGGNLPKFSLVMTYDILYDLNEIKKEINYIINIIDEIKIENINKSELLSRVLSYWRLSIKDKKWAYEKERRYEIRIFEEYEYIDTEISNDYLKVKSSLFLLPDFINKDNLMHEKIHKERKEKLKFLSQKDFLYCMDCLQSDYDFENEHYCKICHSKNIKIIHSNKF